MGKELRDENMRICLRYVLVWSMVMEVKRDLLLRVVNLKQYFPVKKAGFFCKEPQFVHANDGISLEIRGGETLGLVGESGCGKSTFGRTLLQLYRQTDGKTMYYGRSLTEVVPEYVFDTLKNLDARKKKAAALLEKRDNCGKSLESLTGKRKLEQEAERRELERTAETAFLDVAQLVGGFWSVEDTKEAVNCLLRAYDTAKRLRVLKEKLQALGDTANCKPGSRRYYLVADTKEAILEEEKQLEHNKSEIAALRELYRADPEFQEYEKYRDEGIDLARLTGEEIRLLRQDLQLIFQDPYSSLNPRMTVGQIISEGLIAHGLYERGSEALEKRVHEIMEECGLSGYMIHRYPHQFSGGQRQRIGIARALALKPKFVVCDEAVSALDVSIQSQIINLLLDLKEREGLTYLFISHDLSVIKYISDRIGVMYLGVIVELAETGELFRKPLHPYTAALLSAIPSLTPGEKVEPVILEGDIPSPVKPPKGCKFHTRCPRATDICREVRPALTLFSSQKTQHYVACHHPLEMDNT